MSTAFGTKVSGQLITSAWANQVGSAINALEDGNALTLAQILAKFTGTPSVGKFLDYTGAWNTPPLTTDASALTSGTLPLARLSGITTSQLSASAGILGTQLSSSAGIASGQITSLAFSKLTGGTMSLATANSIQVTVNSGYLLNLGGAGGSAGDNSWAIGRHVTSALLTTQSGIGSQGTIVYYNCPSAAYHQIAVGGTTQLVIGAGGGGQGDTRWALGGFGQGAYSSTLSGIVSTSATSVDMGVASTGVMKKYFAGTEKYRFSSALCEFDRLSLGGTIGSSVDPGAGGIAITGRLVFAGAGTASATTSQIFGYAANSHIIYNTPSTYSHSFRTANVDVFILGWSPMTGYADNAFGLGQYGCGGGNSYAGIYSNGTQYLVHNATVAHWFRINDVDKFIIGYSPAFGYGADNWMLGGIKSNGTSQIYYDCTSAHYWRISGGNVAAIGASGLSECGRLSLGGIIGSSVDPGAGGLALTGKFYISTTQTPASAAATGTVGQIAWDSGFVYVCTATNTWKRAAIATW